MGDLALVDVKIKSRENGVIFSGTGAHMRPESPEAIMKVCNRNKYVLIQVSNGSWEPYAYSIYEIQENSINFKKKISFNDDLILYAPLFFGYTSPNRLIFLMTTLGYREEPQDDRDVRRGIRTRRTIPIRHLGVFNYNTETENLGFSETGLEFRSLRPQVIREKVGSERNFLFVDLYVNYDGVELTPIYHPNFNLF